MSRFKLQDSDNEASENYSDKPRFELQDLNNETIENYSTKNFEELKRKILKKSSDKGRDKDTGEDKDLDNLLRDEWKYTKTIEDTIRIHKCACGHSGLRVYNIITNTVTNKDLFIGNSCLEKFIPVLSDDKKLRNMSAFNIKKILEICDKNLLQNLSKIDIVLDGKDTRMFIYCENGNVIVKSDEVIELEEKLDRENIELIFEKANGIISGKFMKESSINMGYYSDFESTYYIKSIGYLTLGKSVMKYINKIHIVTNIISDTEKTENRNYIVKEMDKMCDENITEKEWKKVEDEDFIPKKRRGICDVCKNPHRNRKDNLCNECRKTSKKCEKCYTLHNNRRRLCDNCKGKCVKCGNTCKPEFDMCFSCVKIHGHRCRSCGKLMSNKKYSLCYICNKGREILREFYYSDSD